MFVERDTLRIYRQLAKRWEERASRMPSDEAREQCVQLADAYRSLVTVLDAEPKPHEWAG